jgi:pyruvate kinase
LHEVPVLRRTRIVATLGPATDRAGVLEQLIHGGLDVARINFSHGNAAEHERRIAQVRELSRGLSRPVAILADLPGPKLRVLLDAPITLEQGRELTLALKPGEAADLHVTEPEVLAAVQPNQRVLLDDGRLQVRVAGTSPGRVALRVEVGGILQPNKGINLPDTRITVPALTERDREALRTAAAAGVDWLALSFVRDAAAAEALRGVARAHGLRVPILAKIERPEAVQHAPDIIDAFDGIMVARGDLGVEMPLKQVPHIQKWLIAQARAIGKPVITATDMLDSMRTNPRPTRAEASDVANAVYDRTDAVMLSGETAAGQYPVEALQTMDAIVRETEKHLTRTGDELKVGARGDPMDHITLMACTLAREMGAEAIVAPAYSGRTVRLLARHRPSVPIVVPVAHEAICRQLALTWGLVCVPFTAGSLPGPDSLSEVVHAAFAGGAIREGARVIVTAGHPVEGGERYPSLRLVRVGPGGHSREP